MGCRQVVRHSTLTAVFAGSNPATPAINAFTAEGKSAAPCFRRYGKPLWHMGKICHYKTKLKLYLERAVIMALKKEVDRIKRDMADLSFRAIYGKTLDEFVKEIIEKSKSK